MVIEAAMAGCPVVTHRLGGVADVVVVDGVTGRVASTTTTCTSSGAALDEVLSGALRATPLDGGRAIRSLLHGRRQLAAAGEQFRRLVGEETVNDHVR